jgi:hypothetical protein
MLLKLIIIKKKMKNNQFFLKYLFIIWIGCCILLISIFYNNIQHKKKIDKIWNKYEIDIKN